MNKCVCQIFLFTPTFSTLETGYSIELDHSDGRGQVSVTRFGIKGRIANTFWDDQDAKVFCATQNMTDGIAYKHSSNDFVPLNKRGPFWMNAVNCTGTEKSLADCSFDGRRNLGNCTSAHVASVLCFNDTGKLCWPI